MKVHEWKAQQSQETSNSLESFKEKLERSKVLKSFENCAICSHKLFFDYSVSVEKNEVQEKIMCPTCNELGPTRIYKRH